MFKDKATEEEMDSRQVLNDFFGISMHRIEEVLNCAQNIINEMHVPDEKKAEYQEAFKKECRFAMDTLFKGSSYEDDKFNDCYANESKYQSSKDYSFANHAEWLAHAHNEFDIDVMECSVYAALGKIINVYQQDIGMDANYLLIVEELHDREIFTERKPAEYTFVVEDDLNNPSAFKYESLNEALNQLKVNEWLRDEDSVLSQKCDKLQEKFDLNAVNAAISEAEIKTAAIPTPELTEKAVIQAIKKELFKEKNKQTGIEQG